MSLTAGSKLGPYEILSPLGAGGMGEVYRARDTKLKRDVALKVLPEAFASDPERMARFQREAEVLASLNHPNIAHIYGVEDRALVMEFVDGPEPKGPLPFDEAWKIAAQIADGLEYAHEKGIVHRDLKPANIKISPEGVVKLLDFGLAKAFAGQSAVSGTLDNSPTLTLGATQMGVILGTAAYMAPEQAKGKTVDKRADIWSFGVVLYELLTGTRLFSGEDVPDTLAQVLMKQPDVGRAPEPAQRLLKECLERDPRQRLRDIGDAKRLVGAATPAAVAAAPVRSRFSGVPRVVAGGLVVALGVSLWLLWPRAAEVRPVRFQIPPPAKAVFGTDTRPALSPDGRMVAFAATTGSIRQVWIRSLETLEARPLAGTEGAGTNLFWSADSRSIAFEVVPPPIKLKRVEAAGGPPQTLCEGLTGNPIGAWDRAGMVVFSGPGGLSRVPAGGGACSPLTTVSASRGETSHMFPSFLPDDRHFVYLRASSRPENNGIYVGSLDTQPDQQGTRRLLATESGALYAPSPNSKLGHLLFLREGTLMAQPFDPGRMDLAGDAVPVAEQVGGAGNPLRGFFSPSATGALVYRNGPARTTTLQVTLFDRQGKAAGTVGDPGVTLELAVSPDGTQVAMQRRDGGNDDIWLHEFARGTSTRFTFDPAVDTAPVWSPDGSRIVFASTRDGASNLYQKVANNAGKETLLLKSSEQKVPTDWSRDGRFLLFTNTDPKTLADLWVLPMKADRGGGEPKPAVYLKTEFNEEKARFSPDTRFVAYESNSSGNREVYVRTFPDPSGGQWMVSKGGGSQPHWRRDGKELFYLGPRNELMSIEVNLNPSFKAGIPKELFRFPIGQYVFDVTADGQKFIKPSVPSEVNSDAPPSPITVVLNWQAGLRK